MILFTFSLNKLVISVIIKEIGIINRMILIKYYDRILNLNEYKTFKFELAKVNKAIYLEESKISAGELETDLAKNLTVFAEMVYGYDAMNSIEGTIQ